MRLVRARVRYNKRCNDNASLLVRASSASECFLAVPLCIHAPMLAVEYRLSTVGVSKRCRHATLKCHLSPCQQRCRLRGWSNRCERICYSYSGPAITISILVSPQRLNLRRCTSAPLIWGKTVSSRLDARRKKVVIFPKMCFFLICLCLHCEYIENFYAIRIFWIPRSCMTILARSYAVCSAPIAPGEKADFRLINRYVSETIAVGM